MTCGLVGHGSNRCATTHLYFIKRKPMIFLLYPGGPGQEKASYIETLYPATKEKVFGVWYPNKTPSQFVHLCC